MKQADFAVLRQRILDATKNSAVKDRIRDVTLDADRDDEGSDFLRIRVQLESLDDVADSELEAIVEAIEAAVAELDERSPSVRFGDAA